MHSRLPILIGGIALATLAPAGLASCGPSRDDEGIVFRHPFRAEVIQRPDVEIYDPGTDSWTSGVDAPKGFSDAACVTVGGQIYVVGGDFCLESYRFDPGTGAWESLPDLPAMRRRHEAVAVGREIYVLGGDPAETARVEILDTSTEQWRPGPTMPTARALFVACEHSGSIYVTSGKLKEESRRLEVLDSADGSWSNLSPMPWLLVGATAQILDGRMLVVGSRGSRDSGSELLIYDIESDAWEPGASPPHAAWWLESAAVGSRLFVIGRYRDDQNDRVLRFDARTGEWSAAAPTSSAAKASS